MNLVSQSFRPYTHLDARLAFCRPDPTSHVTFADNRNPHLAWSGVPDAAKSLALICEDPDAPTDGTNVNKEGVTVDVWLERAPFYHWVWIDIPPTLREVAEGTHASAVTPKGKGPTPPPEGGVIGINDYTSWFSGDPDMEGQYFGYDGPCPPWNDERIHAYAFHLFALDVASLGLSGAFGGADAMKAIQGHILAHTRLVGLYSFLP